MAEDRKANDVFNENLDAIIAGIKKLEGAGVTKDVGAKLAFDLWASSKQEHQFLSLTQSAGQSRRVGESPARQRHRNDPEGDADKGEILSFLKKNAGRLGITRDDLAAVHSDEEGGATQPGTGDTEGGRGPEQLHGDKTETAGGRADNTNPGATAQPGGPNEPTTGAPPKVEKGTEPKARGTHTATGNTGRH